MPEAAIGLFGLRHRLRILTQHFQHRLLPQRRVVLPQLHLHVGDTLRIGQHLLPGGKKCFADTHFIIERRQALAGACHVLGQ